MEQLNIAEDLRIEVDFERTGLPSSAKTFRPLVYKEGDLICVLLGPNEQDGVFGSGSTVEEALFDWDNHLQDLINSPAPDDEVYSYVAATLKASVNKVG